MNLNDIDINCYRYQDLWCKTCRVITIHKQKSRMTSGGMKLWTKAVFRCSCCPTTRTVGAFIGMGGECYAANKRRDSMGAGWPAAGRNKNRNGVAQTEHLMLD